MSSERAGTPTHGTLNREKARAMVAAEFVGTTPSDRLLDALEACVITRAGALDRARARSVIEPWLIYEARDHDREQILDALEACVVQDPRITRIEKSCDIADGNALAAPGVLSTEVVRAILRGDQ